MVTGVNGWGFVGDDLKARCLHSAFGQYPVDAQTVVCNLTSVETMKRIDILVRVN